MRNNKFNSQQEMSEFVGQWVNTTDFKKTKGKWTAEVNGFKIESTNSLYFVRR